MLTTIFNRITRMKLPYLLLLPILLSPLKAKDNPEPFIRQGADPYTLLVATIRDAKTNEIVSGWSVEVGNGIGIYSGPPYPDHGCQRRDFDGQVRIIAAPSIWKDGFPSTLLITLTSIRTEDDPFTGYWLVTAEMWRDGTWRNPVFSFSDAISPYTLTLSRADEVKPSPPEEESKHNSKPLPFSKDAKPETERP